MRKISVLVALPLALLAMTCNRLEGGGTLQGARSRLQPKPCGSKPAVAGIAGVNPDPREVYLGDWVALSVCHLDQLMASATDANPVTLFIDGLDSGNTPVGVDLDGGVLIFVLDRTSENSKLWEPLLYNPLFDRTTGIHLGVGLHGERPLPRAKDADLLVRFNKLYLDWSSFLWLALLVAIVVVLAWLSIRSEMLREGPSIAGSNRPYSLGRVQMAWWFFLIIIGFNFIWLVTGDRDTIPASLLGLMGISAATALAAVALPSGVDRLETRRKAIGDDIDGIDATLRQMAVDLDAAEARSSPNLEALRSALDDQRKKLEALRADLVLQRARVSSIRESLGWWNDLVRDDRGAVALDRLQVIVWSLVLGGIFLTSVIWYLTMPELSATLLTLMGVSSGTYIGFKLPQK